MQMHKRQALANAKKQVSQVFRMASGPRGWGFRSWDCKREAWREIGGYTYNAAREVRADQIVTRAYILLGGDYFDAWQCLCAGSTKQRLAQLLLKRPVKP